MDDSVVMDDTTIDVESKLVRSVMGKGTKILSTSGLLPKGQRLVLGENTTIYLWPGGLSAGGFMKTAQDLLFS